MMKINDSGERTMFSTGACRDLHEGKGRMDLLPWAAILEVSKHCETIIAHTNWGEVCVGWLNGETWHLLCYNRAYFERYPFGTITHWMPLPKSLPEELRK